MSEPADKLRELLATRPAMPNTEQLVRWWRTSAELVRQLLDDQRRLFETYATTDLGVALAEARRDLVKAMQALEYANG